MTSHRNVIAKFGSVVVLAGAIAIAGMARTVDAAFILTLDDPNTVGIDVTVTDQGAGDLNNTTVGVITFSGSVGAFVVNVSTGVSKPALGSISGIELNSIDISGGGGSLNISLTDTGFTWLGPALMLIGGTTDGSVTYAAWADGGNGEFAMTNQIGVLGPFSAGAFSGTTGSVGLIAASTPYSLTQRVSIVHTAAGSTSFNAILRVPEPGTLVLLGLGLLGMAVFARRRAR